MRWVVNIGHSFCNAEKAKPPIGYEPKRGFHEPEGSTCESTLTRLLLIPVSKLLTSGWDSTIGFRGVNTLRDTLTNCRPGLH